VAQPIPWYGVWNSRKPLAQGLIIPNFQYPKLSEIPLPNVSEVQPLDYEQFDAIVLSQSCDLSGKAVPFIHICPVDTLGAIFKEKAAIFNTAKARGKHLEQLEKGDFTNQFITNKFTTYSLNKLKRELPRANFSDEFEKFKNERLVINFHEAIVVSTEYFRKFAKSGVHYLTLNPPYREAMAQKYGLFFMRVGNPVNYLPYNDADYSSL
jgi:hypothetical protein